MARSHLIVRGDSSVRLPSLFALASATVMTALVVSAFAQNSQTNAVNLATVATPSSSFISGDTKLTALNDGLDPRNSADARRGSYGNWPQRNTQWVQYEWTQPISTNKIDLYFWADGQGVNLPQSYRINYWDGGKFAPVASPMGLGVARDQYNTTTFDEIQTSRIRVEMDSAAATSTGILEWKVYDSGKSPKFPPNVVAGIDRVVVLGGKTYLNGAVKALQPGETSAKLSWSKQSGPGDVTFADMSTPVTTAMFSATGDYVLKLIAAEGPLSSSSSLNVRVEAAPPVDQLKAVYTKNYTITSALWKDRAKALIVGWIPHCIDECSRIDLPEGGINNFIQAGKKLRGEPFTPHIGYPFSNAWIHNTVESICVAMMVDPQGDPEIVAAQNAMKAKLEEWIPIILAAQEPDGYLQTRFTLGTAREQTTNGAATRPAASTPAHWSARGRGEHEGYVAGYFIESAIAHYLMTGGKDLRLYNAAKKLADCWYNNIGPTPKKTWYDGHQEMEQALVRLGRFVNDAEGSGKGQKYIELARFLLDSRAGGNEYDQSHLAVVQQYEAVGHAVRASYTYSGMADVAVETHDLDYHSAVNSLWDNIVNKKYYLTGGIGSGETSEGFGPNYSLRNNSYCESCSNCGQLFFQWKMLLAYHNAKYADLYEDTLFNAVLGDIDLPGKNFFYTNELSGGFGRYAWHTCPCCVGNISRVLLMLPTWMYAKSVDSIYVNLYVGSKVTVEDVAGTNVEMVQNTEYPYSDKVSITVNPATAKTFAVRIRVPDRDVSTLYSSTPNADGIISYSLNGAPATPSIESGYAVFNRAWTRGDKIDFVLPMKIQRVKAIDKVAADRGRVALRYGPLVYNIESQDQNVDGVLNPAAELSSEFRPNFLNGVMVIKGKFADGSPLLAIPNYVRDNRVATTSYPGRGDRSEALAQRRPDAATTQPQLRARSTVWIKDE